MMIDMYMHHHDGSTAENVRTVTDLFGTDLPHNERNRIGHSYVSLRTWYLVVAQTRRSLLANAGCVRREEQRTR